MPGSDPRTIFLPPEPFFLPPEPFFFTPVTIFHPISPLIPLHSLSEPAPCLPPAPHPPQSPRAGAKRWAQRGTCTPRDPPQIPLPPQGPPKFPCPPHREDRICWTCCGVSAKVKCASSKRWLLVDAVGKGGGKNDGTQHHNPPGGQHTSFWANITQIPPVQPQHPALPPINPPPRGHQEGTNALHGRRRARGGGRKTFPKPLPPPRHLPSVVGLISSS